MYIYIYIYYIYTVYIYRYIYLSSKISLMTNMQKKQDLFMALCVYMDILYIIYIYILYIYTYTHSAMKRSCFFCIFVIKLILILHKDTASKYKMQFLNDDFIY